MRELLWEMLGWLGYLERSQVLVQLLPTLAMVGLVRQARRQRWLPGLPVAAYLPLGLGLLASGGLLLQRLGQPSGLVGLLGGIWLGWHGLSLLERLLVRRLPLKLVEQLSSRLLRPLYFVTAALLMIRSLDSLQDLAVIQLGVVMGVSLYVGKLFNAVLVSYLMVVGSGPPAAALALSLIHI